MVANEEIDEAGILSPEQQDISFFERVHDLGERAISGFNRFIHNKRAMMAAGLAAGTSIGGVGIVDMAEAAAQRSGTEAGMGVRTAKSSVTNQSVLDYIHHALIPTEHWKPSDRLATKPSTAFLVPSSGEFTTNCKGINKEYAKFYHKSLTGTKYVRCGFSSEPGGNSFRNEYVPNLKKEGTVISSSVRAKTTGVTKRIAGNQRKTTTTYSCPSPNSSGTSSYTSKIVLVSKTSNGHSYSEASVYPCS